jgi:hypothetical protein
MALPLLRQVDVESAFYFSSEFSLHLGVNNSLFRGQHLIHFHLQPDYRVTAVIEGLAKTLANLLAMCIDQCRDLFMLFRRQVQLGLEHMHDPEFPMVEIQRRIEAMAKPLVRGNTARDGSGDKNHYQSQADSPVTEQCHGTIWVETTS